MKVQARLINVPRGSNCILTRDDGLFLSSPAVNNQARHILLSLILLLTSTFIFSQQVFRRHFIIAYDVSTPFMDAEKNCPAYAKALSDLFENHTVLGYNEAYQDNLQVERKNGLPFFDKKHDEISFFHFNIAESEFDRLG